ncbi:MAG: GNAT family N-acetyltransferase [Parachlamydiaceae bacterium]|nr:GNAT family N-acetyltransferase [Parachlamydiaceae bacterium]
MKLYCDKALSQRLERVEALSNADFVTSRAQMFPESSAKWIDVAGTYAMFDGVDSPLTQTFGLGLFEEITDNELELIETFFQQHNAPVFHEVSPMSGPSLMGLLNKRGYQPVELTTVMYKILSKEDFVVADSKHEMNTRILKKGEEEIWALTSAAGWSTETGGLTDFMCQFGQIAAHCAGARPFIAEHNGKPISTGMLYIYDHVALLAGASTIPEGRNRGAQSALLDARLRYAAAQGCTLAMMCAAPGSQSQRNAEKNNFQVAYTRTKWQAIKNLEG